MGFWWRGVCTFFVLLCISEIATADILSSKRIALDTAIERINASREKLYRSQTFRQQGIRVDNEAKMLWSTESDEVAIVLHGFLASPFEVEQMAKALQKRGLPVFLPLIQGFGGNQKTVAQSTLIDWQKTLQQAWELLSPHFRKIHLVGFSLGGGLVLDFVLKLPELHRKQLGHVALASPFVKTKNDLYWLNRLMNVFADSISTKSLYHLSRNPDLELPILYASQYYDSHIVFRAVEEMKTFSEVLAADHRQTKIEVPVLVTVSGYDQTIDPQAAVDFTEDRFTQVEKIVIPESAKVRHQILLPSQRHDCNQLLKNIAQFIVR